MTVAVGLRFQDRVRIAVDTRITYDSAQSEDVPGAKHVRFGKAMKWAAACCGSLGEVQRLFNHLRPLKRAPRLHDLPHLWRGEGLECGALITDGERLWHADGQGAVTEVLNPYRTIGSGGDFVEGYLTSSTKQHAKTPGLLNAAGLPQVHTLLNTVRDSFAACSLRQFDVGCTMELA